MKWYGKATEVAARLVDAFDKGSVPDALAQTFLEGCGLHCETYSACNRFLVALAGFTDSRGFHQWLSVGRAVRKGEKAFHILAPCLRSVVTTDDSGETSRASIPTGFRVVPVFGMEQTDVVDEELWEKNRPDPSKAREALARLPLREVAESWGLELSTYQAKPGGAAGYYRRGKGIAVGVENWATWAHELIHAADDRLGALKWKGGEDKRAAEVVAELGGCALLTMLGFEREADAGGAWQYVRGWAGKEPAETCRKLIDRTSKAIALILATAEDLGLEAVATAQAEPVDVEAESEPMEVCGSLFAA